jgi:hypothetical protein
MATNINTILNWFKTGVKPTQAQFWATWASFWHKDEQIPQNSISGLENSLNAKAEKSQLDAHLSNKNAHAELFDKKSNIIHNHVIDDIKGLENVLNEKALLSHKHEITDIEDLESTLNEKALLSHKHGITDIEDLESTLNEKALLSHKHGITDIEDLESTLNEKALLSHKHGITDIEGLESTLNEKALVSHKHGITDIEGLESTLNEKALLSHKHGITDIEDLESTLNEKALLSHKHGITDIEDLESTLNEKALLSHKHEISDIQGLESTLNEKALLSHKHEITDIEGLKDQLSTKLTATLATDAETQIDTNVSEDNKIISRLKLFNWWEWIKKQPLTLSNKLTLTSGNATTPALIIPNGVLTTVEKNGAIERDENGVLWETHGGVRYEIRPTRVCRNLFGAFFSGNSYGNDIMFYTGSAQPGIPLYMWKGAEYNGNILNGIYPSSFNSLTQMNDGDIVETEITLTKGPVGTPTGTPYDLNINVYDNNIVKNTTVYSWDMRTVPYLTLKITLLREKNVNTGIYSHNYLISINGVVVKSLINTGYEGKADCRLTFTSNSNVALYIRKLKTVNLFIPVSII